jgi:hypothetical protein
VEGRHAVGIGGETISMTGVAAASKCRLDEFMPEWKVRSAHRTIINGSVVDVYRALQSIDFSTSKVISTLMAIRSFGRHSPSASNQSLAERLAAGGFMLLAEDAQKEVVFGVVGRFWLPVGNVCKTVNSEEFARFNTKGFAKAAWNISLHPVGEITELRTQTRVLPLGPWATILFRAYWFFVGPFSGWIRREMLRLVKQRVESASISSKP